MNDMTPVITPKSDQLSADDFVGGTKTITITKVAIRPGTEQPVTIAFEDDGGRPWKPCKTMCRLLVQAWGADANNYIGRSVTLYKDPKVKWGGLAVGGIRISHMSHIERKFITALTITKGTKQPYEVDVLKMEPKPAAKPTGAQAPSKVDQLVMQLLSSIAEASDMDALLYLIGEDKASEQLKWLKAKQPARFEEVDAAITKRRAELGDMRTPGSDDE